MDAICKKNKICNFEAVKEDSKTLKETCTYCGRNLYWNKDKFGRLDNKKYTRYHLRDFCQPTGITRRTFYELYGIPKTIKRKEKINWVQEGEDAKKMVQDLRKARQTM